MFGEQPSGARPSWRLPSTTWSERLDGSIALSRLAERAPLVLRDLRPVSVAKDQQLGKRTANRPTNRPAEIHEVKTPRSNR
jgi:hypothetical protein